MTAHRDGFRQVNDRWCVYFEQPDGSPGPVNAADLDDHQGIVNMARSPSHPGEALAYDLEALDTNAAELSRRLKVPVAHFFGTSAQFWLNLQSLCELRGAEEKVGTAIRRLPTLDRVQVRLVADLVRDFGPEKGLRWLREVDKVRGLGVVGIGLGGSEQRFPPQAYAAVSREARERGFSTSAHAGEAAGPASVWGAVSALQVDRPVSRGPRTSRLPPTARRLA